MRTFLLFLIAVLLNGWAAEASAEDLFLGRIVSVDRDAGKISVLLIDEGSDGVDGKESDGTPVDVAIRPDRIPEHLSPGSVVRIWGDLSDGDGILTADRLSGMGHGGRGKDATGVRRRIGKGQGLYGGKGGGRGHGGH